VLASRVSDARNPVVAGEYGRARLAVRGSSRSDGLARQGSVILLAEMATAGDIDTIPVIKQVTNGRCTSALSRPSSGFYPGEERDKDIHEDFPFVKKKIVVYINCNSKGTNKELLLLLYYTVL